MKVREVIVGYGETVSTGEYGNVRPEVRYVLEMDEDLPLHLAEKAVDHAMTSAKLKVYGVIDQALERNGEAPKYYDGPRWKVVFSHEKDVVAVIPLEIAVPPGYQLEWSTQMGFRHEVAVALAKKRGDYTFYDFGEGGDPPWKDDVPEDDDDLF